MRKTDVRMNVTIIMGEVFGITLTGKYWQGDMLTGPVAAARAVAATGAWAESKHMYLIRGSVGASALFLPSAGG